MIIAPERIPVALPSITETEGTYAYLAALQAWGKRANEWNAAFETAVAKYVGVAHAVSLPHATSALHLALAALGVGPGDEVICPDVTWIGSVAPVTYVGATPVLVDVLPDTWCIDPAAVEAAVTDKTKAIIGVDLYGAMCQWKSLEMIAEANGASLIADAAEAMGSMTVSGWHAGAYGDCSVFSFHGSKTVVTGEGGMFCTHDADLHARVLKLRDHGREWPSFDADEIGFKYRMPAVAAALGVAQMERVEELVEHKRRIFGWYRERLDLPMNVEPAGTRNSYWMTTVITPMDRFDVVKGLAERNIDSRPFFSPLSSLKPFGGHPVKPSMQFTQRGVNLPSGANMDEEKVDLVCRALKEVLG